MEPEEAAALRKLGRRSFGFFDGLFVTMPKTALVAVADGKIAGGFFYQIETCGPKKVGIVSFLFTDPAFQAQGIGKRLCEEGIRQLWNEGCDVLVTCVRDDNVASWGLFERSGFALSSLRKLARLLGPAGAIRLCAKSGYGIGVGHDFYLSVRDEAALPRGAGTCSALQIILFIFVNTIFSVPIALVSGLAVFIPAAALVFSGIVLAGRLGALFSGREWDFRFAGGGAFLYLPANALPWGFLPVVGGWYPRRYEKTQGFKRAMAANAIAVWAFLLALGAAGRFFAGASALLGCASWIASVLLVMRCLPIPALESLGFARVGQWNRIALAVFVAASLALVFAP